MNLHLVALPHTRVEPGFCGCAYTNKIRLFCKMMGGAHDIKLYAPEGQPVDGATLVPCLTDSQRVMLFGKDDSNRLPQWPSAELSAAFNHLVIAALKERVGPKDIVLLPGGVGNKAITTALPHLLYCEPFVGYEGIMTDKCAFESYAWMHYIYGKNGITDIRWFDQVIPPYCDPEEFPTLNTGDGEYLLFVGRLISRKGPHIALEIAKACGLPLYVAGAGVTESREGLIVGQDVRLEGDVRHVGPVSIQERASIMANAKALICPTTYVEPGGNVAIEAMLCGTPVIAPDCGVFTETVPRATRFRTLGEAVSCIKELESSPVALQFYATSRYSLTATAARYEHWFKQLSKLFNKGWYD